MMFIILISDVIHPNKAFVKQYFSKPEKTNAGRRR